ncbi:hypothetical protein ACFY3O_04875 [Streptomyces sp. NPDC001046]|uniref:hypothetical protein n=1 Tax=unclassified Streptomyces TaxID=2593676 RepID=UPI0036326BD0
MVTSSDVTSLRVAAEPPFRAGDTGSSRVERHYARGGSRALPPTPLQRSRARLSALRLRLRTATASGARPVLGGDR